MTVFEKSGGAGARGHGDFQGLENWTSNENVLEYLRRLGIKTDFWFQPVSELTFFSPDSQRYRCATKQPILYLIKRGATPGCLDHALMNQAANLGVEVIGNTKVTEPLRIDSSGADRAVAFAHGITFKTDAPDMVTALLDDRLAPKGYAYFIAMGGSATLASAFFIKPRGESKHYFEATLQRYKRLLKFEINDPQEFGGYISFHFFKDSYNLAVGEAACIQDYLFGFGMRLAIKSAELAARSLIDGKNYYQLYKQEIRPFLRAGIVNRSLFERFGNAGYEQRLKKISVDVDIRRFLSDTYRFTLLHKLLYPMARFKYRS